MNQKGMRRAVCLHDGDLLLMLGRVQEYFVHETAVLAEWPEGLKKKATQSSPMATLLRAALVKPAST